MRVHEDDGRILKLLAVAALLFVLASACFGAYLVSAGFH
jgi:hypothetical protein